MIIKDINTCPNPLDGVYNPTDDQKFAAGYRHIPTQPAIAEGYTRVSASIVDKDGTFAQWAVLDRLTSEIEEEARQAKLATFPAQDAAIFKLTMRRNFGEGAETNRAIGAAEVEAHFVAKQVAGTITVQEVADATVLERLFEKLSEWNRTGETWTLPWELVS